jgi:hypothetical protein
MARTKQQDATAKARKWARDNPMTAKATGVADALDCARRWKAARDKLLIQQDEDARLMGDLLSVCRELVGAMRRYEIDADDPPPHAHREMMKRATTVIAKADGQ